jgi:Tfp pilus assembly protein PilF
MAVEAQLEVLVRNPILAVLIVIVTGVPVAVAFAQQGTNTVDISTVQAFKAANTSYGKAVDAFTKHNYEKATRELEASLQKVPEFSDAHLLMAKISYMQKDFQKALQEIEKAKSGFASTTLLVVRLRYERIDDLQKRRSLKQETVNTLRAEYTRSPSNDLLAKVQQAEQVLDDIDRQLFEPPPQPESIPAEYYFLHGNVLLRLQKLTEAVAQYEQALKIAPTYADAANNLAGLYYGARMYAKALEVLEAAEAKGITVNTELKKAVQEGLKR